MKATSEVGGKERIHRPLWHVIGAAKVGLRGQRKVFAQKNAGAGGRKSGWGVPKWKGPEGRWQTLLRTDISDLEWEASAAVDELSCWRLPMLVFPPKNLRALLGIR